MWARAQFEQGCSLSHLTLRFRQVTHERGFKRRPWTSRSGAGAEGMDDDDD